MASVSIYIPTPLRRLTGGQAHVEVSVQPGQTTFAELIDLIEARHPGMKSELWEGADFKHYVNVYQNGEEVRGLEGAATRLADGDQVAFVPMLAGGARLTLEAAHRDEMVAHAIEDAPNECCGVLMAAADGRPYLRRLVNADASPFSYSVRSEDLFDVVVRRPDAGERLLAIYHSHTHTEAYPSQTDVRTGLYPEAVYLIVSLKDHANPVVRGFHIVEGAVSEVEVVTR